MSKPSNITKACPPYTVGLRVLNKAEVINAVEVGVINSTTATIEEPVVVAPVIEKPVETAIIEETVEPAIEAPVVGTPIEALELSATDIKRLVFNDITTVEKLQELVAANVDLVALPKIGKAANTTILEALESWQNKNSETTSFMTVENSESDSSSETA